MKIDTADTLRIVQHQSSESATYLRQLHIWLGVGSAGGTVSMVSLATSLPDPAYVFRFLQPSLWSFLVGIVAAGASLFFLSLRAGAMGGHYAAAHNRDQFNDAIRATPVMFSSPQSLANDANRDRNALIKKSNEAHECAEREWVLRQRYSIAWRVSLVLSALAFVFGFAWPLAQVSFFGGSLLPFSPE
ncbi:hypothetical protein AAFN88_06505 [Pelagibius sp. CAU 1746]|uniref:hypothetical protein n=1 Tax=Pelagibius sp. CAU 1746 TaxID=3140370 RepID=UPI00325A68BF